VALRAAGVFPGADPAGEIAGIDVAQAGGLADFGSLQQIFDVGIALAVSLHFVVAVKCGYVPRDIGRDGG